MIENYILSEFVFILCQFFIHINHISEDFLKHQIAVHNSANDNSKSSGNSSDMVQVHSLYTWAGAQNTTIFENLFFFFFNIVSKF